MFGKRRILLNKYAQGYRKTVVFIFLQMQYKPMSFEWYTFYLMKLKIKLIQLKKIL